MPRLGGVFSDGLVAMRGLLPAGLALCVPLGLLAMAWAWGSGWLLA